MKPIAFVLARLVLGITSCSAQDNLQADSKPADLQRRVDEGEANIKQLAGELRAAKSSGLKARQIELTEQLSDAVLAAFDLQTDLHLAQLDAAEEKIQASRRHIAERKRQAKAIVSKRFEELVNVPPHAQSPQAVLDAMEKYAVAEDYEGLLSLMTDDEADRMAGMLLHSGSLMTATMALMQTSTEQIEGVDGFQSILSSSERFMRPNPPAEAKAALERVVSILPSMFYEIGATSNGKPLKRPNLSAEEYMSLLRQASGVLTDTRAFSTAMLNAVSAMETDSEQTPKIKSQWSIKIDGVRATATQMARPIDRTTSNTSKVELEREDGLWKISQLGSDEEIMESFSGPSGVSFSASDPLPDAIPPTMKQAPSPASSHPASQAPVNSSFPPQNSVRTIIRERIQGRWIVESLSEGNEDGLTDVPGTMEIIVEDNVMRLMVGTEDLTGPILLADSQDDSPSPVDADGALSIDMVYDPNGDTETHQGILACDGESLSICLSTQRAELDDDFRPTLFIPGSKVSLMKCRRANPRKAGVPASLRGRWRVITRIVGGIPSIANGRFVDNDDELAGLQETIPREELLAGPWILEVSSDSLSLRHGPSDFPYWSHDITGEGDDSFAVAIPKAVLESQLAAFMPELKDQKLGGRFSIEGDELTLCISRRESENEPVNLTPNADVYFECVRETRESTGSETLGTVHK